MVLHLLNIFVFTLTFKNIFSWFTILGFYIQYNRTKVFNEYVLKIRRFLN